MFLFVLKADGSILAWGGKTELEAARTKDELPPFSPGPPAPHVNTRAAEDAAASMVDPQVREGAANAAIRRRRVHKSAVGLILDAPPKDALSTSTFAAALSLQFDRLDL